MKKKTSTSFENGEKKTFNKSHLGIVLDIYLVMLCVILWKFLIHITSHHCFAELCCCCVFRRDDEEENIKKKSFLCELLNYCEWSEENPIFEERRFSEKLKKG